MRIAIIALAAVASCSDSSRPANAPSGDTGSAEHPARDNAHGGAAHREPDLIKIAPDMMRDLRVTIGRAEARVTGETVSALGELHVNEDAYAEVASPVAARVTKILAKPGDKVTAGQTLALLHSAELAQSTAEIGAAKARLDIATKTAERKRALADERLIPEREKLDAEAALAEAEAAYNLATTALRKYGGTSGDNGLAIKSPLAGTVIDRSVVMGQLADPSKTLFRVGDLSTLWLIAHVFERDAVRVEVDRKATASFAALPGKTTEGVIRSVAREVDAASRTVAIRIDIPNADGVLRPGMSATASIPLGEAGRAPVIVVPAAAVQRVGSSWAVFIPHGAAGFEARAIGRGRDLSGEVEVLSGLRPGEELIIEGAFLLKAEADKARGGGEEHEH